VHSLGLDQVVKEVSEALKAEDVNRARELLFPALDQKPDVGVLWFYAGIIESLSGRQAVAYQLFRHSNELEPHPANWANLGGVLRTMGRIEECRALLNRGLERMGENADLLGNLSGSYVNEGDPLPGIDYGERALKHAPDHGGAKFNLSLLYLENGQFDKGFDFYAEGAHRHRIEKRYEPDPPHLTPEFHAQNRGQGKKLIVWAEQGIGDELMFSTVLADAKKDYEIIFECHARLESLFKTASWYTAPGYPITLYPTRKVAHDETVSGAGAHFKTALGNLGRFYRRSPDKFRWDGPVYRAPANEAQEMRAHLEAIADGRKIIGLALRGGTMSTARTYRVLQPEVLHELFSDDRYLFVSLDYEDMTGLSEWFTKKYRSPRFEIQPPRFVWYPSVCWAWDFEHQAALVAATDAVVTVCQSIAHLSAGMGHPTYVMTPSRPAWRYGLRGESWFWYPHPNARLLRQVGDDWRPASTALVESLGARFFENRIQCPLFSHEANLLEGLQPGSMCELGSKRAGVFKRWFTQEGWSHVSIDLNGEGGALVLDLQKQIDPETIGGPFDIVTNFGTTEHVDEQWQCWENAHELVKEGGHLISATPFPGDWPGHGRWYPSVEWYHQFAALNGYVIEREFVQFDHLQQRTICMRMRKAEGHPFSMPSIPIFESGDGKTGAYPHDVKSFVRNQMRAG
jgi:tetratricopeptide (TPR) repeat protein